MRFLKVEFITKKLANAFELIYLSEIILNYVLYFQEESVSENIETKEQTKVDLASADLEKKKVESESLISRKEPAKEDKIEVEVIVEPATPEIEKEKLMTKEEHVKEPEEHVKEPEEYVQEPEEICVEMKVQIQDKAPEKEVAEKPKEQEKPHVEETPKKSFREVEVKAKTPKKEEEKPQLKMKVEEKPSTPKKKVEEKPVAPKKEVEEKPKWKKNAEETNAKPEEKVKSKKEEVFASYPE